MKHDNTQKTAREYMAPVAEPVNMEAEDFLMTSSLEDYGDNPIFGAPASKF